MNANNILYETALKQFDTVAVSDVSGGAYNPKGSPLFRTSCIILKKRCHGRYV